LGLSFFGLTSKTAPQYRVSVFKHIHEIVFHGNGGYSWYDVYNMPIWLRKFTFNQINKFNKEQNARLEGKTPGQSNLITPDGKINKDLFPQVKNNNKPKTSYK